MEIKMHCIAWRAVDGYLSIERWVDWKSVCIYLSKPCKHTCELKGEVVLVNECVDNYLE
jgi:hypothetical protein